MGKFVYAVARGRQVGVFGDWNQCKVQVDGFTGARFKKFPTQVEAEEFIAANRDKAAVPSPSTQHLGKRKISSQNGAPAEKTVRQSIPDGLPVVYTDGACSSNGRKHAKAGWGVFWGEDHVDNACGPVSGAPTNNRAELEAVKVALKQAIDKGMTVVLVRTDSKLLINSLDCWIRGWKRNGWKTKQGEPVKNVDLLEAIHKQRDQIQVHFEHVAAHVGIPGNEAADQLARQGAAQYKKP